MTADEFLLNRIHQLEIDLRVAHTNAAHWKSKFEATQQPKAGAAVVFELSSEQHHDLTREATMRGTTTNALAKRLIETVVRDKLFNAVLDQ